MAKSNEFAKFAHGTDAWCEAMRRSIRQDNPEYTEAEVEEAFLAELEEDAFSIELTEEEYAAHEASLTKAERDQRARNYAKLEG